MIALENPPQDVSTRLQYLEDSPLYLREKPLQIVPGFLDREKRSNVRLAPGEEEQIHDVRGVDQEFSLDKNGFCYVKCPTDFTDWNSQKEIGDRYLDEVETLLRKEVENADEIIFFDARLRHKELDGARIDGLSYNPFARQVHVDQTESSIITKIRSLTEMKADFLLRGRVRIINVWRPVRHPVYDCALAVADGSNLSSADVIECDRVRRDNGQFFDTMGVVKFRPGYHWYYMSRQDEEDVLIFKNYDSDQSVSARHCLHTAFDLENVPEGAPPRESIEVRALIFTYPDRLRNTDTSAALQSLGELANPSPMTLKALLEEIEKWKREAEYYKNEAAYMRTLCNAWRTCHSELSGALVL